MRRNSNYWSRERCVEIALTCKTKTEFRLKCISAYNSSWKNGWLDEICSHMKTLGNLRKRLVYSYEFSDNSVYVGITCDENRRNNQHIEMFGAVYDHIKETNIIPIKRIISSGYIEASDAQNLECDTVSKYVLNGWNLLNKNKTGGLGGTILIWTKEKCYNVAMNCKTRKEFSVKHGSAYISARKNGWLNDICEHMALQRKSKNYWNFENCKSAANDFETRFEFSRKCSGAYFISSKNGWLDIFYPKQQNLKTT